MVYIDHVNFTQQIAFESKLCILNISVKMLNVFVFYRNENNKIKDYMLVINLKLCV